MVGRGGRPRGCHRLEGVAQGEEEQLRNKIKEAGFGDVTVVDTAIANLSDDADLVVTHKDLTPRAMDEAPSAQHVSVDNFMNSPEYDVVVETLRHTNAAHPTGAPS